MPNPIIRGPMNVLRAFEIFNYAVNLFNAYSVWNINKKPEEKPTTFTELMIKIMPALLASSAAGAAGNGVLVGHAQRLKDAAGQIVIRRNVELDPVQTLEIICAVYKASPVLKWAGWSLQQVSYAYFIWSIWKRFTVFAQFIEQRLMSNFVKVSAVTEQYRKLEDHDLEKSKLDAYSEHNARKLAKEKWLRDQLNGNNLNP